MPPTPVKKGARRLQGQLFWEFRFSWTPFLVYLAALRHHFGSLLVQAALEGSPDAPQTLSEWPVARPVAENDAIRGAQGRLFERFIGLFGSLFLTILLPK